MKLYKYLALAGALTLGLTSCDEYLDVNVNPDSPTNESLVLSNRIPWMQKFFQYYEGPANMRTSCISGMYYSTSACGQYGTTWNCQAGQGTTAYQVWFVGVAANYNDTYKKAEAEGAYHYMAAADVIYAMGFMGMLDQYGEMPFTDALSASPAPVYDRGKTIWEGCLAKLDEAIELFGRTQEPGATPLSAGDIWNNGDINKWIKLCNGLKARYLLRISKRADFNADEVLAYVAKGPQSNAENTSAKCYNSASDPTDYLWGDPIQTNGNYDYASYGTNQRYTKFFVEMLTNLRGAGVEDPRYSKIVPAMMSNVVLGSDGRVQSNTWTRSQGVDCTGDAARLVAAGWNTIQLINYAASDATVSYKIADSDAKAKFIAGFKAMNYTETTADKPAGRQYKVTDAGVDICYPKGKLYIASNNYLYAGDTIYVNLKAGALRVNNFGQSAIDCNYYYNQAAFNAGVVAGTGSFQTRPISDQDMMTYHEMCFIKAECLFRKGDKNGALQAYREGIKANMDRMQTKLNEWKGLGTTNPDMMPMDEAAIAAYMASAAVCQNAGELTMSDIMLQKYIAMGCSIENWVDMRRFNYSAGNVGTFGVVYPGFGRSKIYADNHRFLSNNPQDVTYWIRRISLPTSLELGYNEDNALKANPYANADYVFCLPVWWDCATDSEYEAFLSPE